MRPTTYASHRIRTKYKLSHICNKQGSSLSPSYSTCRLSGTHPRPLLQLRALSVTIPPFNYSSLSSQTNQPSMDPPRVPYCEQDHQKIAQLVRSLGEGKGKSTKGFKAKKTTFDVKGSSDGISVDSWRLQEWDYKRSDLPTYARGLFTTLNRRKQHEIAVRGYDKFFNVGEVSDTKWDSIRQKTQGPYELTLKENGCIIFISGLEDETLLVCSKHSTGDRSDVEVSHASAGDRWIDKQLATIGRTREELARELRRRNVTAVAELCDDAFEEHILAYGPDKAGLYLHGINLNLPQFMTYSSPLVQEFAEEWGFRKIGLQYFDDIDTVKSFLDGVAESGAHEGRDVEGFVVRCRQATDSQRAIYNDWFFKYKFDEPYLMYRQWRECTKSLIAGKQPRYKKHTKITEEYLLYARKRLAADPKMAKLYNQNHGIIGLRNDFLAFKNLKGSDAANLEAELGVDNSTISKDIVLVPIATIGCGKTTVGIALTHLFGWGIIQNDNIQGKQRPVQMTQAVLKLLMAYPVVISDRNNSEARERKQIIQDTKMQHQDARLVALNFAHGDMDEVRRVTRERVLKRGDNHQTIQAASDEKKVVGIMENFLSRFQPCDPERSPDDGFDLVIDLDPTAGCRVNVETVVKELHRKYPLLIKDMPNAEAIEEASKAAIEDYKPDLKHTIPDRSNKKGNKGPNQQAQAAKKKKPLEYMSVSIPSASVRSALESVFKDTNASTRRFFNQLQTQRRIQPQFHVTLMHRVSSKQHPELWQRYTALEAEGQSSPDGRLGECDVILERVVWSDRIMAIVVRLVSDEEDKWKCVNKVAHVTVGTRDDGVKPKESNDLLGQWLETGSGESTGISERVFEEKPCLKGVVRGVLSR
ncbi:tRNA ligase [Xylariaceae sp. FL0016]|nr:tRNA ligase [Xylariaceae sp. FL0016]